MCLGCCGALGTRAEDLGIVPSELKAVFLGYRGGPLLDGATVDFLGAAALGTHQMVVMGIGIAVAVQRLTRRHMERIDRIDLRE